MGNEKKTNPQNVKKDTGKKKKKRIWTKVLLIVVEFLVLLVLLIVLVFSKKTEQIERVEIPKENIIINDDIPEVSQEVMLGYTTVALFGLDNRSNGKLSSGRSDVIIIAAINNDTKEVRLSSVYRDSYLDVGGGTFSKCNNAYAKGGPEAAINMLNKNLDLTITDYVTVDFNAVVECVDLLGGVEITITMDEANLMRGYQEEIAKMTKKECNYLTAAGTYNMDGVQACAYSRIRQTAGDDYKRTERQRLVISQMVAKAQKSDISTLNKLINEVFSDILTSFSNKDLLSLASQMFNYKLDDTAGFPFSKNSVKISGKGDVVAPCDLESNVVELHKFLYEDDDYVPSTTVKANSLKISSDTGFTAADGYR